MSKPYFVYTKTRVDADAPSHAVEMHKAYLRGKGVIEHNDGANLGYEIWADLVKE